MKKVFLIHGFEGSPNGGWRPWLMGELEKLDVYACALPMPKPEAPALGEWIEEIARNVERNAGDEIFLVGHSLGAPAILHYLETAPDGVLVEGALLVSAPARKGSNPKTAMFYEPPFDFSKIKSRAKRFHLIHGDNDPLVPVSDPEFLAKELGCGLTLVPNGGHLNGSAGWLALPQAFEILKGMFSSS